MSNEQLPYCAICEKQMRYYLKRRKFSPLSDTLVEEKICFSCATGGVFKRKQTNVVG